MKDISVNTLTGLHWFYFIIFITLRPGYWSTL